MVFLPSRDEPEKLDKTISMLFDTCSSNLNFDLFCVIDEDQESIYRNVINKHEQVFFKILKHNEKNYSNIMSFHFDLVKSN